jgi:hypothetical protein
VGVIVSGVVHVVKEALEKHGENDKQTS